VISVCWSITTDAQRTFVNLQFAHSMTQKLLNLVNGMSKILESVWVAKNIEQGLNKLMILGLTLLMKVPFC
jgi:hypothetical protein